MIADIGEKIKELRVSKGMTLKDLGEATSLSTGFLSQLERGLTTIAVDILQNIATVLGVEITYFIRGSNKNKSHIIRSYEREVYEVINSKFIHYDLSNNLNDKSLLPRMIEILPMNKIENIKGYGHSGEEFLYVIEGVLTLIMDDRKDILYPGDSAHYSSHTIHNWSNETNKKTKILVVGTPNNYKQ